MIALDPGLLRTGASPVDSELSETPPPDSVLYDFHLATREIVSDDDKERSYSGGQGDSPAQEWGAMIERLLRVLVLEVRDEARNRRRFEASMHARLDAMSGVVRPGVLDEQLKIFENDPDLGASAIVFINDLSGSGTAVPSVTRFLDWAASNETVQVVCTTGLADFNMLASQSRARCWKLRPIEVKELSVPETAAVLTGLRPSLEHHHKLRITDEAVKTAAALADHLLDAGSMPEKGIDLLDDACSRVRVTASLPPVQLRAARQQYQQIESQIENAGVGGTHDQELARLRTQAHDLHDAIAEMEKSWHQAIQSTPLEVGERDVLLAVTTRFPSSGSTFDGGSDARA